MSACGSDDDSRSSEASPATDPPAVDTRPESTVVTPPSPATTDVATTVAEYEPVQINAVMGTESLIMTPILYARAAGLFEKYGLEVDWVPTIVNSPAVVQMVESGDVDFGFADLTSVINGRLAGLDIHSIAMISTGGTYQIVLSNDAIQKLEDSGLDVENLTMDEKFQALEGLTIARSPGGINDNLMNSGLINHGADPTRVNLVPNSDAASFVAQTREGQIDGFIFGVPASAIPEAEGFGRVWIDYLTDLPEFAEMPIASVQASSRASEGDRAEVTRRLLLMLAEAKEMITNEPDDVAAAIKPMFFEELDQAVFDISFDKIQPAFTHGLIPTEEGFSATESVIILEDGSNPDLPLDEVYDLRVTQEIEG